jgi:hypothetical protein
MTQDKSRPEEDPAEGSRKSINKELERQPRHSDNQQARERLDEQVEEETDLRQKGAP